MTTAPIFAHYLSACQELFADYGLQPEPQGEPAPLQAQSFVSSLGATGEQLNLLSALSIEAGLLAAMHPILPAGGEPAQRDLEDWCRELNNQLVGRLKNKLLRCGCEVMIGLPTLVSGTDLSAIGDPSLEARSYRFRAAAGVMHCNLALQAEAGFALGPETELEEIGREGVLFLF